VPLDALSCVIQEFLSGVAALFCGAPYYSNTILECIGNRAGSTRSLAN
jgi:hypothetical protein